MAEICQAAVSGVCGTLGASPGRLGPPGTPTGLAQLRGSAPVVGDGSGAGPSQPHSHWMTDEHGSPEEGGSRISETRVFKWMDLGDFCCDFDCSGCFRKL